MRLLAAWVVILAVQAEESCDAKGGGQGKACAAAVPVNANATCAERGFDSSRLSCSICRKLADRLEEQGNTGSEEVVEECLACCRKAAPVELFSSARLIADANIQERDQDLHDFIKRKAPLFPQLEVEYMEAAEPAVEFERDDQPDRVVRAVVTGWKSNHLADFLGVRLEQRKEENSSDGSEGGGLLAAGVWTAEIQSCSG